VITPQAIDPAHPFPFVTNGGMGVMMSLTRIADGAQVMDGADPGCLAALCPHSR
jgi:polyphosphate kinase